jgi:hypothetical protein
MRHSGFRPLLLVPLLGLFAVGCSVDRWQPRIHQPDQIPADQVNARDGQTLKVHLVSGDLLVMETWREDLSARELVGTGIRYNARREALETGFFRLAADSVLVVETQVSDRQPMLGLTLFSVYATVATVTTALCVADPKSCFGSCPTFYVSGASEEWPHAEGFSRSVARVLEERDIDALYLAGSSGGRFPLTMRNEALETHAVRRVDLLYARRPEGGRVLATRDGTFHPVTGISSPTRCTSEHGDCLEPVLSLSGKGWSSVTDSTDLSEREIVEIEFASAPASAGLIIGARHTFVSTHLFYQLLAYLGEDATAWLALMERGALTDMPPLFRALNRLGQMEIQVQRPDGAWEKVGLFDEAGPLATDVQVVPLPYHPEGPVRIRLDMTRGFWRVDYLALGALHEPIEPDVVRPSAVRRGDEEDAFALATLLHPDRYLMTYPGDLFTIEYDLPEDLVDAELFVDSQGYYYEWMRQEWLAEQNTARALEMMYSPLNAFRRIAPDFKKVEADMERMFWASRFRR